MITLAYPLAYNPLDTAARIIDNDGLPVVWINAPGLTNVDPIAHRITLALNATAQVDDIVLKSVSAFGGFGRDQLVQHVTQQRDTLQAQLVTFALERDLRKMAEASNAKLIHENHNLNWALGAPGHEVMYTPEEEAAHQAGVQACTANIERLAKRGACFTNLLAAADRVSRYLSGGHYEPRSDDEAAAAADLFRAIEAARGTVPQRPTPSQP